MKKINFKVLLILMIFINTCYKSQKVTVHGIARDTTTMNNILIGISVNDTLNKFRKAFEDENGEGYDKLIKEKKFFTFPDSAGNYTITAKMTDTLYFSKVKYTTQKYKVADIINNNIIVNIKPVPCIPYKKCDQKETSKLYAFVGKKKNVSSVSMSQYCGVIMSSKYKAEYNIEQEFAEHYPGSEIVFTFYDHNNSYDYYFPTYDTILIFIGEYCGELIQFRNQFFPVYKTTDGRWASPVKPTDEQFYKPEKFPPESMAFDESVSFPLPMHLPPEQVAQLVEHRFPEKYYKIKDGKAYPIMGRYAEDLVKLWKEIYFSKEK